MAFNKAVKSQAKLRAALFGPSGAGKTFTALEIATGITSVIGGKIALIDSERSSASKYADRFDFDQADLEVKDIDEYVRFIKEAAEAGYTVLIIDSLSHAWQMLLDSVEKLANAKYRGNTWSAWSEGTPEQRKLVDAIVSFPGHIIVTMRSKTEWQTSTNDRGKTSPVRVGLAPEQGKGIEYEFDILFEINPDHLAHIIKDRSGKFQDKIIEKPGKKFGQELIAWLNEGSAPPPPPPAPQKTDGERYKETLAEIGNVLDSVDGSGRRVFSVDEKDAVRTEIKEELAKISDNITKLVYVEKALEDQKIIMDIRLNGDASEASVENQSTETPSSAPAQETSTTTATTEPPTAQAGEAQPDDDNFEDDIPGWDDERNTGKGGNANKSLKGEFIRQMREKANTDALAKEAAGAGDQLDIF